MSSALKKVPLNDYHEQHARMFEFAGFYMPLFYSSILTEHISVRENVGLFDVSHMGRVIINGNEALDFINYLTANDVNRLLDSKSHYSLFLNDKGGIIDDIFVYRISSKEFLVVYNASNRKKDYDWLIFNKNNYQTTIRDISDSTLMFAIQGPKATSVINNIFPGALDLKRFYFKVFSFGSLKGWISRTGYTGEDGFEIIVFFKGKHDIIRLWSLLDSLVKKYNGSLCGLGARDSLRLEAGYCLYGNDINDDTNPFEANLSWVVKLDQKNFIGKSVLMRLRNNIHRLRVGIVMKERSIPRHNFKIYSKNEHEIGFITSGGFSPLIKKGIGMGYVDIDFAKPGAEIYVNIRGKLKEGVIKKFPLYEPSMYGYRRKTK